MVLLLVVEGEVSSGRGGGEVGVEDRGGSRVGESTLTGSGVQLGRGGRW